MLNVTSLRLRYTQFFVFFVLFSMLCVMIHSIGSGITGFQDNLYKKDILIEKAAFLRIKLGDRVFPQVLLGKDGWMEYTGGGNIDDFQNVRTLGNKRNLVKQLKTFNIYLKSQGITLLIVVAPNKATIYPDKLPEQIQSLPTQSRLDSLISYLEDNNLPVLVDLRPALRTARQGQEVYSKTDTHWDGNGAFVAYTTIINALGASHPELKPYETADLKLVSTGTHIFGIPRLMHANFITEPAFFYKPLEPFVQTLQMGDDYVYHQFSSIQDGDLPKLLMFHDSFGSMYLNDYLSMNFRESHFVRLRGMPEYLTEASIRQFEPDIIVIEIVERNLDMLPDYLPIFSLQ